MLLGFNYQFTVRILVLVFISKVLKSKRILIFAEGPLHAIEAMTM